jgi:hypothetical protein
MLRTRWGRIEDELGEVRQDITNTIINIWSQVTGEEPEIGTGGHVELLERIAKDCNHATGRLGEYDTETAERWIILRFAMVWTATAWKGANPRKRVLGMHTMARSLQESKITPGQETLTILLTETKFSPSNIEKVIEAAKLL